MLEDLKFPFKSVSLERNTKRKRGRPRKVELIAASPSDAAEMKARQQFIVDDPLLKKMAKDTTSFDVMDRIMFDLAKESANLSYDRQKLERKGEDISMVSGKKITALKSVADLYFKKRDALMNQSFDFKSKRFEKFLEWLLINVIRESAVEASFTEEQINILFDHIASKFSDDRWTEEAMVAVKS